MPRQTVRGRDKESLGGRLTARRMKKGLTQHELAALVGTSQAVIQRIETGKCRHPRIIEELGRVLEVSPAWLMYGAHALDGLEQEAIEIARAWSRVAEPHRSALKDMVVRIAQETERARAEAQRTAAAGLASSLLAGAEVKHDQLARPANAS